jgi:uncharacterized protein (TIGR03083 family)
VGDVWAQVAAERVGLADELDGLAPAEWEVPSRCAGWRVRDVAGHLVHLAEGSYARFPREMARHGRGVFPNRTLDGMARETARAEPADLTARLRAAAAGRFRAPGAPPSAALAEVIVHGEDIRRPLGRPAPDRRPDDLVPLLDVYRRVGRYFTRSGTRGLRLVATDAAWDVGSGPEVRGPALSLLLAMAGRPPAPGELDGPGVEALRARARAGPGATGPAA